MVINILSNRSKWTFYFLSSVQFNFTIGEKKINLSPYTTFSKKKSYRAFIDKKISFKDFSTILYKAYGYDRSTMTRGYGSGGALYPVNVIIFILNDKTVENLPNGIYYFQPLTNNLYPELSN